jgi:hypothetical protein
VDSRRVRTQLINSKPRTAASGLPVGFYFQLGLFGSGILAFVYGPPAKRSHMPGAYVASGKTPEMAHLHREDTTQKKSSLQFSFARRSAGFCHAQL